MMFRSSSIYLALYFYLVYSDKPVSNNAERKKNHLVRNVVTCICFFFLSSSTSLFLFFVRLDAILNGLAVVINLRVKLKMYKEKYMALVLHTQTNIASHITKIDKIRKFVTKAR